MTSAQPWPSSAMSYWLSIQLSTSASTWSVGRGSDRPSGRCLSTARKRMSTKCLNEVIARVQSETLYHRDDALLYIAYAMLIWAAPIPADRWHCAQSVTIANMLG